MDGIILEMLPANEGDCILITLPREDICILVDGGTKETYHNVLKNKLQSLKAKGKAIDLLIVTHIDDDHIGGVIELLKENGTNEEPNVIRIKEIWHNSYRHLQFEKNGKSEQKDKEILNHYIMSGMVCNYEGKNSREISIMQGTTLASLILKGGYYWNTKFRGKAVCTEAGNSVCLGEECVLTVLGPSKEQLSHLARKWKQELKSKRIGFQFSDDEIFDDAYECYMRYFSGEQESIHKTISFELAKLDVQQLYATESQQDFSVTNRSSIVFCLQYRGKKILLLGDAIADHVCEGLGKMEKFDLIKLPHHGSKKNITRKCLEEIETGIYLISTNSAKHGHPDLEVLAKIVCKKTDYTKRVFFNYEIERVNMFVKEIKQKNNTEFVFLQQGQKIEILCDETENGDDI